MRLLVFQHIACEHPGIFRKFLAEDGIAWDAVELDEGDSIPDLGAYDALWVMGGPMDVWDREENPWPALPRLSADGAGIDRRPGGSPPRRCRRSRSKSIVMRLL